MADDIEFNTRGLDKILKALKEDTPMAKVGILGDHNFRSSKSAGESNTNAAIGAKHEFGDPSEGLPIRSFLRVPITENMQKALDNSDGFDKAALGKVVAEGSLIPWIKKIGIVGESIVLEAFDTGGFGKWTPSNMGHKKNQQTLVETQQLRNSITSEVDE